MINLFTSLEFREPLWLFLSLQPLMLYMLTQMTRKLSKEDFVEPHLLAWVILDNNRVNSQPRYKSIFLLISWLAFSVALSGPRIALKTYQTQQDEFTNIMVLLDVSRSMSARDVHPSRLERAKLELYDFIDRSTYSRIGLVLYAAKPHLLSPLTTDKDVLRHYVTSISSPLLPTRGSDLESALQFAASNLTQTTTATQAILLISDGENTHNTIEPFNNILSLIKDRNIAVYSLVVGTDSGAPILDNESGWLKHDNQDIISHSQPTLLKEISLLTNGLSSEITENDNDWIKLHDSGMAKLNPVSSSEKNPKLIVWKELSAWPIFFALTFFILAFSNIKTKVPGKNASIIPLVIFSLYLLPSNGKADESYQQAYHAYQQQDYQKAIDLFSKITGYNARVGEANAAYMAKNYKRAITLFIQATLDANTDTQRSHALFNLANSYYQLMNYEQATKIYQDVLRYNPEMEQARINLGYAIALSKKQQEDTLPTASRGGKGPRIARIEPGADITKGNLTLGTDNNDKSNNLLSSPDTSSNNQAASTLSSAGLVTRELELNEDTQWTYQVTSHQDIAPLVNQVVINESVFWVRLFEWEEGFPAPLAEPLVLPGKMPW